MIKPCKSWERPSRIYNFWISIKYMVLFLLQPGLMDSEFKEWKWVWCHSLLSLGPTGNFHFLVLWPYVLLGRGLSSEGRDASTKRHNKDSIEQKFRLLAAYLRLFMKLNKQAKKGATVLPEVLHSDCQVETGLLLPNEVREEYAWNTWDSLGHLSIIMLSD